MSVAPAAAVATGKVIGTIAGLLVLALIAIGLAGTLGVFLHLLVEAFLYGWALV